MTPEDYEAHQLRRLALVEKFFEVGLGSEERAELDRMNDEAEEELAPYNTCYITTLRSLMRSHEDRLGMRG